jgi:hypothetical protein
MDPTKFLEQLKFLLGIDPTDTSQDAELTKYIEIALATIEDYLGRALSRQAHAEEIFDSPMETIIVRNWPIVSVESIEVDNVVQDISNFSWTAKRSIIFWTAESRQKFYRNAVARFRFATAIKINYTAGYTDDDIPQWLTTAVCFTAAAYANLEGRGVTGAGAVKKFSIPGVYSEEYETGTSITGASEANGVGFIPPTAQTILNMYRDKRVG